MGWQKIEKIEKIKYEDDVYNLHIEDNHNYFANGSLVKNCHLASGDSLTNILYRSILANYRVGFTGTIKDTKTHHIQLQGIFGKIVKIISTKELMDKNVVSKLAIKAIVLDYPDEIKKVNRTYQEEVDFIISDSKRNNFIANLAASLPGCTIILIRFVDKHGLPLYELLKKVCKKPVYYIDGNVKADERERIRLEISTQKECVVLGTVQTMSTGINVPKLSSMILAHSNKSKITTLQSIGRILRKHKTKNTAVLFDIVDKLTWKKRKSYSIKHFTERLQIYRDEKFSISISERELYRKEKVNKLEV